MRHCDPYSLFPSPPTPRPPLPPFLPRGQVCCLAGKSENPAEVMPRAIAGTLIGATVLSVLAQLALSGMVPWDNGGPDDDGAHATSFEAGFRDHGWGAASRVTAVGEVLLLPLVVLVSFLPQPELFAALAEDGLLPQAFAEVDAAGTLRFGTLAGGLLMTIFSCVVTGPPLPSPPVVLAVFDRWRCLPRAPCRVAPCGGGGGGAPL